MRVLFIYPSIDCPPGINHGLADMAGVLKAHGHQCKLIHVCDQLGRIPNLDEMKAVIRDYQPGIIGFSAMSQQYQWCLQTARGLKEEFNIPLIVGGVHCTMVPDEVVADQIWDFVCVGEADYSFLELVKRLERGEDTSTCPNMRLWNHGQPIKNPVAPFPDLADLPPKDYELFELGQIIRAKKGWMGMLTSRGCPYKCTYCFNKEIVDQYMEDGAAQKIKDYLRHYPIEIVLRDIRYLKERYPEINTLIFDDDLFTLSKNYVHEFCRAYLESGIGLPYVVNAHVQVFNDEMARDLKESGCIICKFGLESGSERVRREVLWRPMGNETIKQSFAAAHRFELHTSAFIMFGLPFETRAEIAETLQLCAEVKMGRFRWALFFPFPGTMAYTIANNGKLIDFEKMAGLGNYFDGSCLKFGEEHDLYLDKLAKVCNWYVNALTDWPSAPIYQKLVDWVEAMDWPTWRTNREQMLKIDRETSDELLAKEIPHYSIRYCHVMGVHSDYVGRETQQGDLATNPEAQPYAYTLD